MHSLRSGFSLGNHPAPGVSVFKLVVAYADFGNGILARQFCEEFGKQLPQACQLITRFLKFEDLLSLQVSDDMTREAEAADMVVIAASEGAELPDRVKDWLWSWRVEKGARDRVLMALIHRGPLTPDHHEPVRSLLRQVARRMGMKFMSQSLEGLAPEPAAGLPLTPNPQAFQSGRM